MYSNIEFIFDINNSNHQISINVFQKFSSVENKEVLKSQSDQELAQEDDDQEEDKAGQSGDQSKVNFIKGLKIYCLCF